MLSCHTCNLLIVVGVAIFFCAFMSCYCSHGYIPEEDFVGHNIARAHFLETCKFQWTTSSYPLYALFLLCTCAKPGLTVHTVLLPHVKSILMDR